MFSLTLNLDNLDEWLVGLRATRSVPWANNCACVLKGDEQASARPPLHVHVDAKDDEYDK